MLRNGCSSYLVTIVVPRHCACACMHLSSWVCCWSLSLSPFMCQCHFFFFLTSSVIHGVHPSRPQTGGKTPINGTLFECNPLKKGAAEDKGGKSAGFFGFNYCLCFYSNSGRGLNSDTRVEECLFAAV